MTVTVVVTNLDTGMVHNETYTFTDGENRIKSDQKEDKAVDKLILLVNRLFQFQVMEIFFLLFAQSVKYRFISFWYGIPVSSDNDLK